MSYFRKGIYSRRSFLRSSAWIAFLFASEFAYNNFSFGELLNNWIFSLFKVIIGFILIYLLFKASLILSFKILLSSKQIQEILLENNAIREKAEREIENSNLNISEYFERISIKYKGNNQIISYEDISFNLDGSEKVPDFMIYEHFASRDVRARIAMLRILVPNIILTFIISLIPYMQFTFKEFSVELLFQVITNTIVFSISYFAAHNNMKKDYKNRIIFGTTCWKDIFDEIAKDAEIKKLKID